jgi:hypothetical protein
MPHTGSTYVALDRARRHLHCVTAPKCSQGRLYLSVLRRGLNFSMLKPDRFHTGRAGRTNVDMFAPLVMYPILSPASRRGCGVGAAVRARRRARRPESVQCMEGDMARSSGPLPTHRVPTLGA